MKISHMKKDELFEGFYLIKSADLRQTRAGKNYLAFTFQDDSGEIEGKLWDAQPHNVEAFTAGKVVHMKGRREVYNNTPQVNSNYPPPASAWWTQWSSWFQGQVASWCQGNPWLYVANDF